VINIFIERSLMMRKLVLASVLLIPMASTAREKMIQPIEREASEITYNEDSMIYTHDNVYDAYMEARGDGSVLDNDLEICIVNDCRFYALSASANARTTKVKTPRGGSKKSLKTLMEVLNGVKSSTSVGVRASVKDILINPDGSIQIGQIDFFAGTGDMGTGFEDAMQKNHK
jgi:hypothetical protein